MTYLAINYACVSIVIGFFAGRICFLNCRGTDEDYTPSLFAGVCVWLHVAIVWPVFLTYLVVASRLEVRDDIYRK